MENQQKTTWIATIVMAFFLILYLWQDYKKNPISLGYYLLGKSVLITIAGIGMSFSKKERERTRERVTAELPERALLINSPNADSRAKHRGYILLAIGIMLFIVWLTVYGFSSLSTV